MHRSFTFRNNIAPKRTHGFAGGTKSWPAPSPPVTGDGSQTLDTFYMATIRALRKIDPASRVIAASGLDQDGAEAAAGTIQAFLRKPYTAEALLTALKRMLGEG